jgi:hypothetical protein
MEPPIPPPTDSAATQGSRTEGVTPICPHCCQTIDRLGITSAPGVVIFTCPLCNKFLSAQLVAVISAPMMQRAEPPAFDPGAGTIQ